jgi:hypothetical protein
MPDYSQGKIYTIRCRNDPALIYVGSTIQPLSKRFGEHKRHSKNTQKYPNHQLYTKIEDWNDWYIELVLVYPCNSVEELRQKEGEIIRAIGTLNRGIAGRTIKEWKQENPEKVKIHREKDKIREIENGRRDVNPCECGGRFSLKTIREHERSKRHINYLASQAGNKLPPL